MSSQYLSFIHPKFSVGESISDRFFSLTFWRSFYLAASPGRASSVITVPKKTFWKLKTVSCCEEDFLHHVPLFNRGSVSLTCCRWEPRPPEDYLLSTDSLTPCWCKPLQKIVNPSKSVSPAGQVWGPARGALLQNRRSGPFPRLCKSTSAAAFQCVWLERAGMHRLALAHLGSNVE